ncbi:hypothetical protein [Streptomyces sp. NPDC017202]|uniref:hypothetical protein n=1 Tax=Streptomyces sp. NPDC017202 TaxID=3364981 RepID=UPI0037A849B2
MRAQHLDLTHRPLPDGRALPGRTFVVENYAPLTALRRTAPASRELAWHAGDDTAPGRAMWNLWTAHVTRRLLGRLRRTGTAGAAGAAGATGVRPRVVRQGPPPPSSTGLPEVPYPPRTSAVPADDERASSR